MAKLIQAIPGMPKPVTEPEVEKFLSESRLNVQIATLDDEGYPTVYPIWFLYDRDSGRIYCSTGKQTRKIENIRKHTDRVYFSIDDESVPYKGVKGRAEARIIEGPDRVLPVVQKINLKYLGTNDDPLAQRLIGNAKKGDQVIIELTPKYFSAWDFAKAQ